MRYFFFLLSLFYLVPGIVKAQDELFIEGFVITLEGDTINGLVKQSSTEKLMKLCTYKGKGGAEIEYSPWQIKGYGFEGAGAYATGVVDSSFVEVLVYGELSAYKRGSDYYLGSGGEIGLLKTKIISYTRDGVPTKAKSTKWIGVINYFIQDCNVVDYDLQRKKLSDKLIIKIVTEYNQCKGTEYYEYKKDQKWTSFNAGIALYYTPSTLKVNTDAYPSFADTYSASSFTYGLAFNIYSPKISKRLVFQLEILNTKAQYSADLFREINQNISEYAETFIDLSTVSLPISFKYMIPKDRYSFYVMGGASIEFNYEREVSSINEFVNEVAGEVITYVESPFSIQATTIGFNAGLGLSKSLNRIRTDFLIRYQFTPLRGSITTNSNLSRLNIGLLFFTK